MLVVIIISVLAAAVIPRLSGRSEQAKVARAKSDLAAIGVALDLYEMDVGQYPDDSAGLNALLEGHGEENWKGPYLKKGTPSDPWGNAYLYKRDPQNGDYSLTSPGPDRQAGGSDDITNQQDSATSS